MSPEAIPATAAFRLTPRMVQPISSTPFLISEQSRARHPHGIRRIRPPSCSRERWSGSDIKTKLLHSSDERCVYRQGNHSRGRTYPKDSLRNNRKQHSNNIIKPIMRRIYSISQAATAYTSAVGLSGVVPFGLPAGREQFAGQQRHKHERLTALPPLRGRCSAKAAIPPQQQEK